MKSFMAILVSAIYLLACQVKQIEPANLTGEWRYVGNFSHLADYRCIICPEFDYDKSIYRFTVQEDNTFSTRINLLIGNGKISTTAKESTANTWMGDFRITDLQILNKPYETQADSDFKENFQKAYNYYMSNQNSTTYDQLNLTYEANSYLVFVRRK